MKNLFKLLRTFFLLSIIILPLMSPAQENSTATKAQKKADKKKEKQEAQKRKAELKGKKFHYQIQDKATRKRMKKHRRRVDHGYPSGRPGFFKRLFGRKQSYIYNKYQQPEFASGILVSNPRFNYFFRGYNYCGEKIN